MFPGTYPACDFENIVTKLLSNLSVITLEPSLYSTDSKDIGLQFLSMLPTSFPFGRLTIMHWHKVVIIPLANSS